MEIEGAAAATLDASDIAVVAELGARRQVSEGEYLYREGDVTYDFFVLTSAEVDIVVTVDGGENTIVRHGPGRFLGELNMLSGLRVFVSARVVTAGEVIVVPRDRLRQLIATKPLLGDTILAAFVARRDAAHDGCRASIRVIGSQFSPESSRVREFLARTRVPHQWLDPDRDPQVEDLLRGFGIAANELPVVIATGSVLRRPTPGELASYLGLTVESLPERCFDLVVVGRRPSRPRRRGVRGLGGAAHPRRGDDRARRTSGDDLTDRELPRLSDGYLRFRPHPAGRDPSGEVRSQPHRPLHRGVPAEPSGSSGCPLERRKRDRRAGCDRGHRRRLSQAGCRTPERLRRKRCVLRRHRDGVAHVRNRAGRGRWWRQLRWAGGDLLESERMCGDAGHPGTGPEKSMSRYLVERIEVDPRITLRARTTVVALEGDETLRAVRLEGPEGETVVECAGLFSFIGADPSSGWLSGCAALDERGFVLTDLSLGPDSLREGWDDAEPAAVAVRNQPSGSLRRGRPAVGIHQAGGGGRR